MINILYLKSVFLNSHNDNDATLIRMIYAKKILIFASSRDTQMRNELYLMLGSSYTVKRCLESFLYTLWLFNIAMENPLSIEVLVGKSSINGAIFHGYVK